MAREIVPALGLASFSCPHVNCRAIAHQTWFKAFVEGYEKDSSPWIPDSEAITKFRQDKGMAPDILAFFKKVADRELFLETYDAWRSLRTELVNISFSKCYRCGGIAVW